RRGIRSTRRPLTAVAAARMIRRIFIRQTPVIGTRYAMKKHAGFLVLAAAVLLCGACCPLWAQRLEINPDVYSQLRHRYIGPVGNRVSAIAGVPGNPHVYYAGAASGGIFKTTDGGITWEPIFDGQPVASIGSLAVGASDPNIVWAGTGESFIRSHI